MRTISKFQVKSFIFKNSVTITKHRFTMAATLDQTLFQSILNSVNNNEPTTSARKPVKKRMIFISCILFMLLMMVINIAELTISKINYNTFKCFLQGFISTNKTSFNKDRTE